MRSEDKDDEDKDGEDKDEGKDEGEEDEDEDEDGPLYNMDVLMSEADDLMSSAFKPYHYPKQSEEDIEEDIKKTPIARKIQKGKTVGGKGKGKMREVKGESREVKGDEKRKMKGILLREIITRASCNHADGGNAVYGLSCVNAGLVPGTS